MRWFNFALLVLITVVVQMGIGQYLSLGTRRVMPDLLLIAMVVLAYRGPRHQAAIGCWLLGLAKDLSSLAVLGSYALAFGMGGWIILKIRDLLYRDNPLVLITLTLMASFLGEQFALLICLLKGVLPWENYGSLSLTILFSAIFTAGLAPYGQWLILKLRRPLGLPRPRGYDR